MSQPTPLDILKAKVQAKVQAKATAQTQSQPQPQSQSQANVNNIQNSIGKDKLLALLKARNQTPQPVPVVSTPSPVPETISVSLPAPINTEPTAHIAQATPTARYVTKDGKPLNDKQIEAVTLAVSGCRFLMFGSAGTGKTTTEFSMIEHIVKSGRVGTVQGVHRYIPQGTPGVAILAYTRRAVRAARRRLSHDMQKNCLTIHKFLEYKPVTGDDEVKRFEPSRHALNPIDPSIKVIFIDEVSLVQEYYFQQLLAACPHKPQIILVGDIQQLPPPFGTPTIANKTNWPIVELTEVYRQAADSPIIALAQDILKGVKISFHRGPDGKWTTERNVPGKLTLHPWDKKISNIIASAKIASFFAYEFDRGNYDPIEHVILTPYDKAFGAKMINAHIGTMLAKHAGRPVYEVIAGYNKHYFSIGDKVLFDKEDAVIVDIQANPLYMGQMYRAESLTMDYFGHDTGEYETLTTGDKSEEDIDAILNSVAAGEDEDRVRAGSHIITIRYLDDDSDDPYDTEEISAAGDINKLALGYAMTVHKSQGSEWKKVYFVMHHSQNTMIFREMLYTGVTRASEELYVVCETDTFETGVSSQRIKGDTIQEKLKFFRDTYKQDSPGISLSE